MTVGLFAVLTFGATELAFRVLDIQPPPTPRPSAWDAISVNNERNALGIREEWDSLEPDDRRLRIAFLGDSITFGESVEAAETFSRLVGESMNSFIERGVVTMNLGEPGTGPPEQLAVYRRVAPELRPYIVVHVLYPNDLGDDLYGMLRGIYAIRDADLWVGDYSYVLKYAEKKIRQWAAMRETFAYFRGGATAEERDQAWSTLREDVVAVKEAVEADGGTYYMVLFPWLFRLDDYPLGGVHQRMRALAEELRVSYLDLFDTFGGMAADDVRISRGNEHPNAHGHQLAADAIVEFLRRELLPH